MVDGDVFRVIEAAESAAAQCVSRKQTNKGRAAVEELAKTAAAAATCCRAGI